MSKDLHRTFAAYIPRGEEISVAFTANWRPRPGKPTVPAHVALTPTRLLIAQRFTLFGGQKMAVELSQIIETQVGGGVVATVTLATTGGQRVEFSAIRPADVRSIQDAVAVARR